MSVKKHFALQIRLLGTYPNSLKYFKVNMRIAEAGISSKLDFYTNLNVCTDVGITPVDEIFIWGGSRAPLLSCPYFIPITYGNWNINIGKLWRKTYGRNWIGRFHICLEDIDFFVRCRRCTVELQRVYLLLILYDRLIEIIEF